MGTEANHPDGNAGLVNMKLMGALLKISIKNKSASTKSFSWQYSNIETNAFYQSGYYILDAAPAPNSFLEYVPEADPYLHTGIPPASDPSATQVIAFPNLMILNPNEVYENIAWIMPHPTVNPKSTIMLYDSSKNRFTTNNPVRTTMPVEGKTYSLNIEVY